jgi:hypothetical protein
MRAGFFLLAPLPDVFEQKSYIRYRARQAEKPIDSLNRKMLQTDRKLLMIAKGRRSLCAEDQDRK